MIETTTDVIQGTLDMLILKTLSLAPMHGYGIGRRIEQIELPKGVTIGALVRGEKVLIAHHDTVIEAEDHVILFVVDKRIIPKLEKLFLAGGAR